MPHWVWMVQNQNTNREGEYLRQQALGFQGQGFVPQVVVGHHRVPLVPLHAEYWHGSPLLSVSGHEKTPQILETYGVENPPLKNAISRLVQPCYGVFGVIIRAV